ncbi:hypothetical protein DFH29DRAFT_949552 [Suillus ampliporus]|nr:hypothetical protein DFH29DRAFT_949552 [Suillus ampliporus]
MRNKLKLPGMGIIHRFATQSLWFMDPYRKGLQGKQAAYAVKRYHGHCTLPLSLFKDLNTLN